MGSWGRIWFCHWSDFEINLFGLRIVLIILSINVWNLQKESHHRTTQAHLQKHLSNIGFHRRLRLSSLVWAQRSPPQQREIRAMQKVHRIRLLSLWEEVQVCPWVSRAPQKQHRQCEVQNKRMCDLQQGCSLPLWGSVQFHPREGRRDGLEGSEKWVQISLPVL